MTHTLETERLLLRPWAAEDVGLLASLSSNPAVTRYIGLGHTWSAVKAIAVSDRATDHWREHGFGWRVALEMATGEEIGLIALSLMGEGTQGVDPEEHEIGWWLSPSRWGRGYAAEGARAVAADAFAEVGAPFVTARIRPENVASIHVATTIGMQFEFNTVTDPGVLAGIYRASAPTPAPASADTAP